LKVQIQGITSILITSQVIGCCGGTDKASPEVRNLDGQIPDTSVQNSGNSADAGIRPDALAIEVMDAGIEQTGEWGFVLGAMGADNANTISVDRKGNVYIAGGFTEETNLGDKRRQKTWRSDCPDEVTSVRVGMDGNIYVGGHFSGSLVFDQEPRTSKSQLDLFFMRLTKDGILEHARQFGTYGMAFGRGMALDNEANMLITGSFYGTLEIVGKQLRSISEVDIFLASIKLIP